MPLCRYRACEMCQQFNSTEVDLFACTAFPQRCMNNPMSFQVTDIKIEICFLFVIMIFF